MTRSSPDWSLEDQRATLIDQRSAHVTTDMTFMKASCKARVNCPENLGTSFYTSSELKELHKQFNPYVESHGKRTLLQLVTRPDVSAGISGAAQETAA